MRRCVLEFKDQPSFSPPGMLEQRAPNANVDNDGDASSDYSFDLSPEDEALLLHLVDQAANTTYPTFDSSSDKPDSSLSQILLETRHDDLATEFKLSQPLASVPGPPQAFGRAIEEASRSSTSSSALHGINSATTEESKLSYTDLQGLSSQNSFWRTVSQPETEGTKPEDTRSPLERFRTYPRKPFTVSDLTSGSWCELQYYYTLSRLPGGRKVTTKAMKAGTKVHRKLEEQVHSVVKVDATSREDRMGLRMWNMVQSLRTLQQTGLTRELEVWGTIDGHLVNGVIDALSWENPDPNMEASAIETAQSEAEDKSETGTKKPKKRKKSTASIGSINNTTVTAEIRQTDPSISPKVYLTDVKTRGIKTKPSSAFLYTAQIQLYLYYRLLSEMIDGKVDYFQAMRRRNCDPDKPFTDQFLAQLCDMSDEFFLDPTPSSPETATPKPTSIPAPSPPSSKRSRTTLKTEAPAQQPDSSSSQNSFLPCSSKLLAETLSEASSPTLSAISHSALRYTTLRELIPLITTELRAAFAHGKQSLGPILCIEYRNQKDSALIARHAFCADSDVLNSYLETDMQWWRGDRAPRGVPMAEAFKCRSCDFAETCEWRLEQDASRVREVRSKLAAAAAVDATE